MPYLRKKNNETRKCGVEDGNLEKKNYREVVQLLPFFTRIFSF